LDGFGGLGDRSQSTPNSSPEGISAKGLLADALPPVRPPLPAVDGSYAGGIGEATYRGVRDPDTILDYAKDCRGAETDQKFA
jgi:hypothetical protein